MELKTAKTETMEETGADILEPFELNFSDLVLLSSSRVSSFTAEELERLESISRTVMETLGPLGPGLLAIAGVPKASELRTDLLPLARKLSLLSNEDRRRILTEHSLGSDVPLKNPNRSVSSFAMQLRYVQDPISNFTIGGPSHNDEKNTEENPVAGRLLEFKANEFKNLGNTFKELGLCMMELGLLLARVCDRAIGGKELEQSILDSCTAKGRLIHYHSSLDSLTLKEVGQIKGSTKRIAKHRFPITHEPRGTLVEDLNPETSGTESRSCKTSLSNLWQQWHYDYGIFTVLTAPMFISPSHQPTKTNNGLCTTFECPPPDGHTHLQIFDPNKNKILVVRVPTDSFVIQVGESADILSKGNLHSTLHSVCRPVKQENLSRETFVVFLQPSWGKIFSLSRNCGENSALNGQCSTACNEEIQSSSDDDISSHVSDQVPHKLSEEIKKIVPPLSSRLRDGMTFAEFSRETTKQYYGGNGMQSKR